MFAQKLNTRPGFGAEFKVSERFRRIDASQVHLKLFVKLDVDQSQ